MPYTKSQNKLFHAAAHDPKIAAKHHITQSKASELASEGVKSDNEQKEMALQVRRLMLYR